jgi:hypothetical protein
MGMDTWFARKPETQNTIIDKLALKEFFYARFCNKSVCSPQPRPFLTGLIRRT